MTLPIKVKDYLERRGLPFSLVPHPPMETLQQVSQLTRIPPERLVRVVLLRDTRNPIMAILPSSHILDFSQLCRILQRGLEPLYGDEITAFFEGCENGSHPPLPGLFGLQALVEQSLGAGDELYFDAGSHDVLVRMASKDFKKLLSDARWEHFAPPLDALSLPQGGTTAPEDIADVTHRYTPARLKSGIEAIKELPALPTTAHRIVALNMNPRAHPRDLARIVEHDPSLAAQIIRWARSPYYGYRGRVDSVEEAITRVLGFDMVMNLTLGIALGRPFRIALDGPLGLRAFWRHSVYCATMVGELVKVLPSDVSPRPGMAYLGGLLHNFGYLLLGHLFPAQFFLLNRFLAVNTHLPLRVVENYVLGAEHPHIGAWLMQAWHMPEELTAAVRWHHQEDYSQPYAEYPNLVLIANRLLHRCGIGDEDTEQLPGPVMSSLGLDVSEVLTALERVMIGSDELDDLSRQLSA